MAVQRRAPSGNLDIRHGGNLLPFRTAFATSGKRVRRSRSDEPRRLTRRVCWREFGVLAFQSVAVLVLGPAVAGSATVAAGAKETVIERFQRRDASGDDDDEAFRTAPGKELERLPCSCVSGDSGKEIRGD